MSDDLEDKILEEWQAKQDGKDEQAEAIAYILELQDDISFLLMEREERTKVAHLWMYTAIFLAIILAYMAT